MGIDGIVLRYSAGVGRNQKEAELALAEAKKRKKDGLQYNLIVYSGESQRDSFLADLEAKVGREADAMIRLLKAAVEKEDAQQIDDARIIRYDSQTGLLKRAGYVAEVRELKEKGLYREGERFFIIFDADNMKELNDDKENGGYELVNVYLNASGRAIARNTRQRKSEREDERRSDSSSRDLTLRMNDGDIIGIRPNDGGGDEILVDLACKNYANAEIIAKRLISVMYDSQKALPTAER